MSGGEPTFKVSETANVAPCTLFVCIFFFFFGVSVRVCESLIVLMRKRYKTERKRKESVVTAVSRRRSTNVKLVNLEEPKCNGGVIFFTSKFIFQMLFRVRSIWNSK